MLYNILLRSIFKLLKVKSNLDATFYMHVPLLLLVTSKVSTILFKQHLVVISGCDAAFLPQVICCETFQISLFINFKCAMCGTDTDMRQEGSDDS